KTSANCSQQSSTWSIEAISAIEQPAARLGRMTDWFGFESRSAVSAMKCNAAEDDRLGLRMALGGPGEHERVADVVGVLDDLDALVVMSEHDHPVAEGLLGGADPGIELLGRGLLVLLGDLALTRGFGRDRVGQRGSGAVAGADIDVPRGVEQLRRTHVVLRPGLRDVLECEFDRSCCGHHRPSRRWAASGGAVARRETA